MDKNCPICLGIVRVCVIIHTSLGAKRLDACAGPACCVNPIGMGSRALTPDCGELMRDERDIKEHSDLTRPWISRDRHIRMEDAPIVRSHIGIALAGPLSDQFQIKDMDRPHLVRDYAGFLSSIATPVTLVRRRPIICARNSCVSEISFPTRSCIRRSHFGCFRRFGASK